MPLEEIDYTATGDTRLDADVKINLTIEKVNEIDSGLPGGATGEILKKASNADYDYTWVANQDISVKADKTQLLIESISGLGPSSFAVETTMLTLTPSASKACAKMKYTFSGYIYDSSLSGLGATLRIKKAGIEIAKIITGGDAGVIISFCLVWIDSYAANDSITATAETATGQELNKYILICESLNAV